jgi:hypothetical protein
MVKRKTQPAAPVIEQPVEQPVQSMEQPPADPAPPALEQVETPAIEEAAQPPVVETPPAPDPDPVPAPAPAEVESLAAYAARIEEAAQPLPVCQITHPDAKDGAIHIGKYAGIRLVCGDTPAALLSDGSSI